MTLEKTPPHIKIDERHHVEKPLLDQLQALDWEVIDLEMKQEPKQSFRQSFDEVVLERRRCATRPRWMMR